MTRLAHETPLFFDVDAGRCFGVLTHPDRPNGMGVMIVQGGDTVNVSMQRNRLAVRLARRLADRGFLVLRFDYHGLGESTGDIGELNLTDPLAEEAVAAGEVLRTAGAGPIVMVGACFSARTVLAAGAEMEDVAGIVAATPPIAAYDRSDAVAERMARDRRLGEYASLALRTKTLTSVLDPTRRSVYLKFARSKMRQLLRRFTGGERGEEKWWVSRDFLQHLETLGERGVPTLLVYGAEDPLLREFDRGFPGRLGRIVEESNGAIEIDRDLPGEIHGFPTIPGQEAFLEGSIDWILRATERSNA